MEQEYLSVKQFAEQSGCTPQRVYQLLRNRLQPFLKVENGVKYIHVGGLQVVEKARVAQGYNKGLARAEDTPDLPEPEKQQVQEQPADSPAGAGSDVLQATIDALTAQLDAKDKQINDLTAALTSAQVTLIEMQHTQQVLTDALTVSQQTQKQLTDALSASQALQAGTIQALRDMQQNQPESAQEAPVVPVEETPEPEQQSEPVPAEETPEKQEKPRRGFWARIFRKEGNQSHEVN